MSIPSPWIALLLLGASYRIWLLLAEDTILDRPRRWVVGLDPGWEEGLTLPERYRLGLARFITCPWCLGFWVALAVWGLWQIDEHWIEVFSVPLALSAAVGIVATVVPDD